MRSAGVCGGMLIVFEAAIGGSAAIIDIPSFYKLAEDTSDDLKHDAVEDEFIHAV